jgi:type I restriction enzyme S subunit
MADKILNSFDVWIAAQGWKSKLRVKNIDNISLDGIARLRELILELAIRGKLVTQDPHDEPAGSLLSKVKKEKEALFSEGKIKKERIFPEIGEHEKPFVLPSGWEWTRIQSVGHDWGQKEPTEEFSYIEVSGIDSSKGILNNTELTSHKNAPSRARKIVKKGTVIYSTVRPYLKNICMVDTEIVPEPIASTAFAVVHPLQSMPGKYFVTYFRSPTFVRYVESIQIGIAYPAINDGQFFSALVPVPPLKEQHRIVSKVDELMALCDELEEKEANHLKSHQLLVVTLLGTLTHAKDAFEFQNAWARLTQHFDDLFTTDDSVDQLKDTLLQLAFRGVLGTQNKSDKSARELFARIEDELVRKHGKEYTNKLKRDKSIIEPAEFQYPIPDNWIWCELQDIAILFNGKAHEQFIDNSGKYKLVNSRFVSTEGRIAKLVSDQLTPLHKRDIAIVMSDVPGGGALVKCFLINENRKYSLNQRIGGISTASQMNVNFLSLVLSRNKYYLQYDDQKKQTNLKKIQILSCPIPLPPLEEQARIVSKIDELFVLCNHLKDKIAAAQTVTNQIADSVMEQIG